MKHSTDANVFFKIFKESDRKLKDYIENLGFIVDSTVYIECIQGSKSNLEKRKIQNYLNNFPLLPITPRVSELAIELIDSYSNSHGLLLADALIAANALENNLTVITYNVGDFKFISGLRYLKPTV